MNKPLILIGVMLAACTLSAMTDTERQYLHNLATRPRCESRTCTVIGGVTNVVEVWRRGEFTWAQTNPVRRVVGTVQRNTMQDKINEARAQVAEALAKYADERNLREKAEAKAAAVRTELVAKREDYQAKYDKASAILKPVYKAFIDIIDALLAEIDKAEVTNGNE